MKTASALPYSWLRLIPQSLKKMDHIPLWGGSFSFPWHEMEKNLQKIFQIDVSLKPSSWEWKKQEELLAGFENTAPILEVTFAGIEGSAYWVMGESDLLVLMSLLLKTTFDPLENPDEEFKQGFYTFTALEAIHQTVLLGAAHQLSPELSSGKTIHSKPHIALDIAICSGEKTINARILASEQLVKSFRNLKVKEQGASLLENDLEVIVHLEAGRLHLTLPEWREVKPGDFIPLSFCRVTPGQESGRVLLTIGGVPFFRGKIKNGKLKILEHPLHYELDMDKDPSLEDQEEFDSLDEHDPDTDSIPEEDEEALELASSDEASQEPSDSEEDHEDLSEEEEIQAGAASQPSFDQRPLSVEEIPLNITVEVGRLQMTVKKLMELEPGNLLELDARPQDAVDLVVNGKVIAKGELLLIEETLGVRILETGLSKR